MEIDIKKIYGNVPKNAYEACDQAIKAQQEILEALHIFQSTIEFWDDKECLEINKERMLKYLKRYIK